MDQPLPQIRGFEVEEALEHGTSGWVCRATHTNLRRQVVLKILDQGVADEERVERFLREARVAGALRHPNIVALHTVAVCPDTGLRYMTYEYVDGPTVADVLKAETRLDEPVALGIALGVSRALACAQASGVIHRSLRPEKILLAPSGEPKLADLGMASRRDAYEVEVGRATRSGSPFYTAPEVAAGEVVDHRADLYSLGITLFHMLSGALPYQGLPVRERAERLRTVGLPLLSEVSEGLSVKASQICQRLAAWDPSDRYPRAADVQADLEGLETALRKWEREPEPRVLHVSAADSRSVLQAEDAEAWLAALGWQGEASARGDPGTKTRKIPADPGGASLSDDGSEPPTGRFERSPSQQTVVPGSRMGVTVDEEDQTVEWDPEAIAARSRQKRQRGAVLVPDGALTVAAAGIVQIGSSEVCSIYVPGAPRKAAIVVASGDTFRLVNVADTDRAVLQNGEPVPDQSLLEDGDVIWVCGLSIRFVANPD